MVKNINYLFIIILILLCGCASKMDVLSDKGIKEPTHVYSSKHIPTGMQIQSFIAAMSEQPDWLLLSSVVNEDSVNNSYPEDYLSINEPNSIYKIDNSIIGIVSKVKITNPNNIPYQVKLVYETHYKGNKFPHVLSYVLYKGNEKNNILSYWQRVKDAKFSSTHKIIISKVDDETEMFNIKTKYKK